MHARDLMELAAVVALHGRQVISSRASLPTSSLERYWSASKCRLDRWGRLLKRLSEAAAVGGPPVDQREALGALEEIISGDVLARVWAAVLVGHDRRTAQDAGAIARTILVGHQEARNRTMSLLVNGPAIDSRQARHLNYLLRRAECWADLLIGYLSVNDDLTEFAPNVARSRDFASDFTDESPRAWSLYFASLRASFADSFAVDSPNADLNAEIAAGVIACFEPELFDSTGLLRSLWMSRLQQTTSETQCMIDDLFVAESGGLRSKSTNPVPIPESFRSRFNR